MQYITTALRRKAIVAYTLPITFLTAVHSASLVEQARWTAHKDRSSLCIRDSLILIFTQTDMSDGWYYWLYHCLMLHKSCPLLTAVCVLVGFNRAPAVFMAEMCVPFILIIHIVTNGLRSPPRVNKKVVLVAQKMIRLNHQSSPFPLFSLPSFTTRFVQHFILTDWRKMNRMSKSKS